VGIACSLGIVPAEEKADAQQRRTESYCDR
jgi:hypothetical protein